MWNGEVMISLLTSFSNWLKATIDVKKNTKILSETKLWTALPQIMCIWKRAAEDGENWTREGKMWREHAHYRARVGAAPLKNKGHEKWQNRWPSFGNKGAAPGSISGSFSTPQRGKGIKAKWGKEKKKSCQHATSLTRDSIGENLGFARNSTVVHLS